MTDLPISERPVEYRDIPGWPGYRVGDDGSVWSCWRKGRSSIMMPEWHKLKPTQNRMKHAKYCFVNLCINKNWKIFAVHRLVLTAFVGPCPPGMEACHNNGDPADNRLANLRWDTPVGNQADKIQHGTSNRGRKHTKPFNQGSKHGLAKLTEADVLEIRRLHATGVTSKTIYTMFGISYSWFYAIVRRKVWKHI